MTTHRRSAFRALLVATVMLVGIGCDDDDDHDDVAPERIAYTATEAAPIGPYSPAIQYGNMVWLAGQIGRDPATGELGATTADQVRFAMDNIGILLKKADMDYDDIVQAQVFLADLDDYAEMNEAYASYFSGPAPARAAIQAARLPLDARVEILVTAVK